MKDENLRTSFFIFHFIFCFLSPCLGGDISPSVIYSWPPSWNTWTRRIVCGYFGFVYLFIYFLIFSCVSRSPSGALHGQPRNYTGAKQTRQKGVPVTQSSERCTEEKTPSLYDRTLNCYCIPVLCEQQNKWSYKRTNAREGTIRFDEAWPNDHELLMWYSACIQCWD